jgi:alginate O-acetyltransferase complex protein AlgI
MLFNSHVFIFLFLPITLLIYYALGARDRRSVAAGWLVVMSLAFYGWWNPIYLLLIITSMSVNYLIGTVISNPETRNRKALMVAGVTANLSILLYFKYTNFIVDSINDVSGASLYISRIVLPLGISFFTFQKIAYLVDAYQGKTREHNFLHFCLFVVFFPQLIAGPIVHHSEILPQFAKKETYRFDSNKLFVGLTIFFMGVFKKVIIADHFATYASPIFNAAKAGTAISFVDSWAGALAYTYQLYFDFSGYSDMAMGLGWMFGVRLPLNFRSPYKATNIIDFWRRWHMTLSRFLRDYLYIPLGGNRLGSARRYINLFTTMVLGGIWHGAGWTFLVWGMLHGIYLVINHSWHKVRGMIGMDSGAPTLWGRILSQGLTFLAVVVAWVFFRAETMGSALTLLRSMFGGNGIVLSGSQVLGSGLDIGVFALITLIVFLAPSIDEIMGAHFPGLDSEQEDSAPRRWTWRPSPAWAVAAAIVTVISILGLTRVSEFLYFQF